MAATLVPELSVSDIGRSLAFYCDILGFSVRYARPEEGFAYLDMGGAALMVDQIGTGRDWVTAPMDHPFGRGINIQIEIDDVAALLDRLLTHHVALFQPAEVKSYRVQDRLIQQRQFCVQDPDGYLLRFCAPA